jgi:GDP-L-fucose synthase
MDAESQTFVAGAGTLLGRTLLRRLTERPGSRLIREAEPDFADRSAVERFFDRERPTAVYMAAGKTAGISGNQSAPAELMLDNLLATTHVISSAWKFGTERLLYLASSCIYPKHAPQPFGVSSLWSGPVEQTSDAYAVAKLAGVKMCEAYRRQHGARFFAAIAADAYGPGDDFSLENSHVVAALLRRFHEAKQADRPFVDVWGSGAPRREFIYVDDLADACVFAMEQYPGGDALNLGSGITTSIVELAEAIRAVVGYRGDIRFDRTKPDGMPFKGLDSTSLRDLGWRPKVDLAEGLRRTYEWYFAATRAPFPPPPPDSACRER